MLEDLKETAKILLYVAIGGPIIIAAWLSGVQITTIWLTKLLYCLPMIEDPIATGYNIAMACWIMSIIIGICVFADRREHSDKCL